MSSHLETIDLALLVNATGGQAAPQDLGGEEPSQRTWGQMGREYAAACVQGAGQSLLYSGRPRNIREGLSTAALGCAMGVGMKAVDDLTNTIGGSGR